MNQRAILPEFSFIGGASLRLGRARLVGGGRGRGRSRGGDRRCGGCCGRGGRRCSGCGRGGLRRGGRLRGLLLRRLRREGRQELRRRRVPGVRLEPRPHERAERHARVVLRGLVHLVDRERALRVGPAEDEVADVPLRSLELARVLDGAGGAGLDAEPAEHTLHLVDVELRDDAHLRVRRVLLERDLDAADRAGALARLTAGADRGIHLEEPAVARRQHVAHRERRAVRVLHRHRAPHQMREGDGEAVPEGHDRVLDGSGVLADGRRGHGRSGSDHQLDRSTRSPTAEMLAFVCLRKNAATTATATVSAMPLAVSSWGTRATSMTHRSVATNAAKANGTRYFQQSVIIWSMRMRGSVQRIQTMRFSKSSVFTTNTAIERTSRPHHPRPGSGPAPRAAANTSGPANGTCQPPKNSVTETAAITQRFPNSTRKKSANRNDEYSER